MTFGASSLSWFLPIKSPESTILLTPESRCVPSAFCTLRFCLVTLGWVFTLFCSSLVLCYYFPWHLCLLSPCIYSSAHSLGSFCLEFAFSPVHEWVFSRHSSLPPTVQTMLHRLIDYWSPLGVSVNGVHSLCPEPAGISSRNRGDPEQDSCNRRWIVFCYFCAKIKIPFSHVYNIFISCCFAFYFGIYFLYSTLNGTKLERGQRNFTVILQRRYKCEKKNTFYLAEF